MAYTINKTNGAVLTTVEDGTLNTATSVSLVGQNYQGYGEVIAENFVTLLENSANTTAPSNPMTGNFGLTHLIMLSRFMMVHIFNTSIQSDHKQLLQLKV